MSYLPEELKEKDILLLCHRCKNHLKNDSNRKEKADIVEDTEIQDDDANKKRRKTKQNRPLLGPTKAYWNLLEPGDIPTELAVLTDIEKRLISRVKCHVQILRLEGRYGQFGFKGEAILFAQDVFEVIENLPMELPIAPDQTGLVIVTETLENLGSRHFEVSSERVYNAIEQLKENNMLYSDV